VNSLFSQAEYSQADDKLATLIDVDNSFRNAVFIVENTFDSSIKYEHFQNEITLERLKNKL
jgi:PHD/YefM family antitoxin component YafN of YafNO toxin-antitoxin module